VPYTVVSHVRGEARFDASCRHPNGSSPGVLSRSISFSGKTSGIGDLGGFAPIDFALVRGIVWFVAILGW
jgi:hypothetical protein